MEEDRLNRIEALVIGGSAGSLNIILKILPELSPELRLSIIIVLHRKNSYDSSLADLLGTKTSLKVKEAEEKESIRPGYIYLAPADYHLLVETDRTFSLDFSEKIHYSRPGIDATFQTAAEVFEDKLSAILLSGANSDGTDGIVAVHNAGGITVIQDPANAEVGYMPQQALAKLSPHYILKSQEMAAFINSLGAK